MDPCNDDPSVPQQLDKDEVVEQDKDEVLEQVKDDFKEQAKNHQQVQQSNEVKSEQVVQIIHSSMTAHVHLEGEVRLKHDPLGTCVAIVHQELKTKVPNQLVEDDGVWAPICKLCSQKIEREAKMEATNLEDANKSVGLDQPPAMLWSAPLKSGAMVVDLDDGCTTCEEATAGEPIDVG